MNIGLGIGIPFSRSILYRALSTSLYLDFVSNETLDPKISFSRASNATVTKSDGTIGYAPHNLLTHSEQFDNAAWGGGATGGVVAANSTTSPDGTSSADMFTELSGSTDPRLPVSVSLAVGSNYALSVYTKIKPGSAQRYLMLVFNAGFATPVGCNFDLVSGSVGASTGATGAIVSVGNGWYRCVMTPSSAATQIEASFRIRLAGVDSVSNITAPSPYTGDGTSGIYIWGAQLNVGALQPYYPTTVKNLLGYTQEFDNAAWTKLRSGVTANTTTAPDGSITADKLIDDLTASATHNMSVTSPYAYVAGTSYTLSVFAKSAEYSTIALQVQPASPRRVVFDLTANTATTVLGDAVGNIAPVGNGWYRCSMKFTADTSGPGFTAIYNKGGEGYTGDGTSGIYIWGAQLSDSASLDPYVYNPGAAPAASAYYGPRFDYDPVTLAPKGLLIEEQRTNSIRNNTMVGAVAGTPGTIPTNWITGFGGTAARSVVGVGTESGIDYVDVRFTASTAGSAGVIQQEGNTSVSAASGQTWTDASYIRLVGGSLANVSALSLSMSERSIAGASLASTDFSLLSVLSGAELISQRYAVTRALNNALTAFVTVGIAFATSGAVDFTLRIGMPQLELGAFVTSVIPTSGTAATRAADVAVMTGSNFSSWYRQDEGTLFADAGVLSVGYTGGVLLDIGAGGAFGTTAYLNWNGSAWGVNPTTAPVSMLSGVTTTSPAKIAAALSANNTVVAANGILGAVDTSCAMPASPTTLSIGVRGWSSGNGNFFNGHIRRIAYFPRRLSNAELQGITA